MKMSKKAITTKTKIRNNTIKQQKGNMTENSDKTPLYIKQKRQRQYNAAVNMQQHNNRIVYQNNNSMKQ